MSAGELAMEEVTRAGLLHHIRPREACHLTEAIITVDNSAVLHPSIGYDEFFILSLEFPNNYSQKCILWRNMTSPDRHGFTKRKMTAILWLLK